MATLPEVQFRYRWLPYLLNPSTPASGMTIKDYMKMKGYHPDHYPQVHKRLVKMGKEAGVDFNQQGKGNGNTIVNTLDSLRLIDYAQATLPNNEANRFVEAVVWAHHVHGKDISNPNQLKEIGMQFGLKGPPLLRFLKDSSSFAPVPGSIEAMSALASVQQTASLTCGKIKNQVEPSSQTSKFDHLQMSTNETFAKIGSAHSVHVRDREAKKSGIHSVPHIEVWRDVKSGKLGTDCRIAIPAKTYWINGSAGLQRVSGLYHDPIKISGAVPVDHFLQSFLELASMSVVLE